MQRHRAIAGPPQRSTAEAWAAARELIDDTLGGGDTSARAAAQAALAALDGLGPVLVGAGHLHRPMVLRGGPLEVLITVFTGDAAVAAEENLRPVPGGSGAGENWMLHLPDAGALDAALRAAVAAAEHLSCDPPSTVAAEAGEPADGTTGTTAGTAKETSAGTGRVPPVDPAALERLRDLR